MILEVSVGGMVHPCPDKNDYIEACQFNRTLAKCFARNALDAGSVDRSPDAATAHDNSESMDSRMVFPGEKQQGTAADSVIGMAEYRLEIGGLEQAIGAFEAAVRTGLDHRAEERFRR